MALKTKKRKSPFREAADEKPKTKTKPSVKTKTKSRDSPKPLGFSIQKSSSGKIKTSVEEYGGSMHLNIRHYYKSKDGEWLPTKKGITIPLKLSEEFARKLKRLVVRAADEGHEVSEGEDTE